MCTLLILGGGESRPKKVNFPRLVQACRMRLAETFRFMFNVYPHVVPSAATLPRALQLELRCENKLIRTILSGAIESVDINLNH